MKPKEDDRYENKLEPDKNKTGDPVPPTSSRADNPSVYEDIKNKDSENVQKETPNGE